MKIALISDVHLEFGPYEINNEQNAEVLILAGDITTARDIHDHMGFFAHCAEQFSSVIYIPGNHEYYGGDFNDLHERFRTKLSAFPNILFMDRDKLFVDDVTFLAGTMWTDADRKNPVTMQILEGVFNDFHSIKNFSASTMVAENDAFLDFLRDYMIEYRKQQLNNKVVVVTHHAPSFESVHEKYRNPKDWAYNFGFASYHEEVILDFPEIKVWVHGHMHDPFDYYLGDTRVICNPRGYAGYERRAHEAGVKYIDV